jgi:hypothetical protein
MSTEFFGNVFGATEVVLVTIATRAEVCVGVWRSSLTRATVRHLFAAKPRSVHVVTAQSVVMNFGLDKMISTLGQTVLAFPYVTTFRTTLDTGDKAGRSMNLSSRLYLV